MQTGTAEKGIAIYIGRGEPALKGWKGYEYMIEQKPGAKNFSVNKLNEAYKITGIGKADFTINKDVLQLKVSRKQLGAGNGTKNIYFKVTDGIEHPKDIMDTYLSGSAMPMGRLSYLYLLK